VISTTRQGPEFLSLILIYASSPSQVNFSEYAFLFLNFMYPYNAGIFFNSDKFSPTLQRSVDFLLLLIGCNTKMQPDGKTSAEYKALTTESSYVSLLRRRVMLEKDFWAPYLPRVSAALTDHTWFTFWWDSVWPCY